MMNQIISSLSPSAPPLHVQSAPIRKKKRADIRETPDLQLIKQIKDALVTQQLHQKDLAGVLEVRYLKMIKSVLKQNLLVTNPNCRQ